MCFRERLHSCRSAHGQVGEATQPSILRYFTLFSGQWLVPQVYCVVDYCYLLLSAGDVQKLKEDLQTGEQMAESGTESASLQSTDAGSTTDKLETKLSGTLEPETSVQLGDPDAEESQTIPNHKGEEEMDSSQSKADVSCEESTVAIRTPEPGAGGLEEHVTPETLPCSESRALFSDSLEEEEESCEKMSQTEDFAAENKLKSEQPGSPAGRRGSLLMKPDFVDEMSNLSHGDASSSGFLESEPNISPGEPDSHSLSMELGLVSTGEGGNGRLCSDSILTETDDSMPFDSASAKLDAEKAKRRNSPGRSRVKQGRSNSFPGKRRPRGGGGGRGRGRSRLKAMASCIEAFLCMDVDSSPGKDDDDEDDDTMQNTVVLFSNTDKFVLLQDMCVVCGSFGRGPEGHLLACAQCAQCYHPYCVNSKITKVMLSKGWRCLECIVCEVCGKASDPSRLLLCDDCDVSYHTYCLDPPLHTVPKGGWKCKWCVCCMQCGVTSPGFHCEWQNNYTHCAPCASLVACPVCKEAFVEQDLLLQCQHCER
uniref:PHD-type domain-containing protein n=1 Tax=Erpetoichthys calabaricus TaxID=27687 RepID=A0A8C4SFC1_ERPCA